MRRFETPTVYTPEHSTYIVTAGGEARSGKGTSMTCLEDELVEAGQKVVLIDQGIKFRTMAKVALDLGQGIDSPQALNYFFLSSKAQEATLAVLEEVAEMDDTSKKEYLYTSELSKASGKVGKVPSAHRVAVGLLQSQVKTAVETEADVILVDGRSMEKYARQFAEQGLARFVMGWYFKCNPVVAARRSLGLFDDLENLSPEEKGALLSEILSISERNRSDTSRSVDPLREPTIAYRLDLPTYNSPGADIPYKRGYDILHQGDGLTVVDTSYTNSIDEMTSPITELTKIGLLFNGLLEDTHLEREGSSLRQENLA